MSSSAITQQSYKTDRELSVAVIKKNPLNIRHFPPLQGLREMALLAVGINGLARVWLDPKLQGDPEISAVAEKNLPLKFPGVKRSDVRKKQLFSVESSRTMQLQHVGTSREIRYLKLEKNESSKFLRDSQVVLFTGELLIPYTFKEPYCIGRLAAVVPRSLDHFITDKQAGWTGYGYCQENTDQAMVMAYDHKIPFKRAKTCIEGGNCFLFLSKGSQKALIGELSLYLSLVALEEQGYFEGKELKSLVEPSEEAFRMARNRDLYQHATGIPGQEIVYRLSLIAPISSEDRIKYEKEAIQMQSWLELTKECIAEELELSLEQLIFLPQTEFHIDMELAVMPDERVILHDDQKMQEFFQEMRQSNVFDINEALLLCAYERKNAARLLAFKEIQERRKQILEAHAMDVHLLPAVLEAPESKSALNYCNGIFLENVESVEEAKRFSFVTTGPSFKEEEIFHRHFIDLFQRTFPSIELKPISQMSKFIAKHSGGIHCLTIDIPK